MPDPAQGRENVVDDDGHDHEERQRRHVVSAMEGQVRRGSQPAGTNGSQQKLPGLDAGDSSDEAESEAGVDHGHIQVDLEVRIKTRQHSIKLEPWS